MLIILKNTSKNFKNVYHFFYIDQKTKNKTLLGDF